MEELPYAFTGPVARRIMAVVRFVESRPRNLYRPDASPNLAGFTRVLTKNDSGSTWTKGSTVTINVYTGTQGSETANGQTLANVYIRLGDIANGKWCYAAAIGGNLEIWETEC